MINLAPWRTHANAQPKTQSAPIELLRIELDPETHQLRVWLAERPLANPQNIANAELRAQVQGLLQLLTPEPDETPAPAPMQESASAEPPAAVTPAAPLLDDEDLSAPFLTRLTDSLKRQRPYKALVAAKSIKAAKSIRSASELERSGMFAQVDAILQRKLRDYPEAPTVEIMADGEQPLIRVDEQVFTQIDAVPDERVRASIRSAVAEWEARQFKTMRSLAPA